MEQISINRNSSMFNGFRVTEIEGTKGTESQNTHNAVFHSFMSQFITIECVSRDG